MDSIPILKLRDTLFVSIQSELHDRAAKTLQSAILAALETHRARAVIIDVSVLDIVDSFIGRMLSDTARMASLMNATVVLVGIQPAVAITLVELGLTLDDVRTELDLEAALARIDAESREQGDSSVDRLNYSDNGRAESPRQSGDEPPQ